MKRLIRSAATGEFFKAGGWTKDPNQADDFPTLHEAVEAECSYQLRQVELVLHFGAESPPVARIKKQSAIRRG